MGRARGSKEKDLGLESEATLAEFSFRSVGPPAELAPFENETWHS